MAEPLKNLYSKAFYTQFCAVVRTFQADFDPALFMAQIFDKQWEDKELKQRMRHTTKVLKDHLSGDYPQQIAALLNMIPTLRKKAIGQYGFEFMFFADFAELYGLDDYQISINAMEAITQFVSCEFAIRPFIIRYPEKLIPKLKIWSGHENEHVRRLASEGCRPRLPWAMALPDFKTDPTPILPILENLKNDPSLYVRRSVANNLNDIAKDNPDIVIQTARRWYGKTPETDWIVKHASRTLLKQGNQKLMTLFGFGAVDHIKIEHFKIHTPIVQVGERLEFSFNLLNNNTSASKIRLEYGMYYLKANGSLSKKVFKISEKNYQKNTTTTIHKSQSFKVISTRKFHVGRHQLSVIVNGHEFEILNFELVD